MDKAMLNSMANAAQIIAKRQLKRKYSGLESGTEFQRKMYRKRWRRLTLTNLGWLVHKQAQREKRAREREFEEQLRNDRARNLYDEGRGYAEEES